MSLPATAGPGAPNPARQRALRLEPLEPRVLLGAGAADWPALDEPAALESWADWSAQSALTDGSALDVGATLHTELGQIAVTFSCDAFEFLPVTQEEELILAEGFSLSGDSGNPALPTASVRLGLPPDADLGSVSLELTAVWVVEVPGEHLISPAAPAVTTLGDETVYDWGPGKAVEDGKNVLVYGLNEFYGGDVVRLLGVEQMREWKLATIEYSPFAFNPVSGEVRLATDVEVRLAFATSDLPGESVLADGAVDDLAAQLLANYDEVAPLYAALSGQAAPAPVPASVDLVIVTTSAIQSGSMELASFVAQKESLSYQTAVVTESTWGGGTGDAAAENIRSWLSANYAAMGMDYVLLIGNPNPSSGDVPMKMAHPKPSEDAPTDYYYADLTSNWDLDGDGQYGEWGDDFNTQPLREVLVGRIPVYGADYGQLDSILLKTMDYLAETDGAWRSSILLPMAVSNYENEDHSGWDACDGHSLGEYVSSDVALPNSYASYRLYEKAGLEPVTAPCEAPLTASNVLAEWSANPYGLVTWWAHGSETGAFRKYWSSDDGDGVPEAAEMTWAAFFSSSDCSMLDDGHPSIVVQASCDNGYPENSSNLGYSLLKNGAVATYSTSRVAWYAVADWYPSLGLSLGEVASYGYYIPKRLAENEMTETTGAALQWCRENFGMGWVSGSSWMNAVDINLYGDPTITLGALPPPVPDLLGTSFSVTPHNLSQAAGSVLVNFTLANAGDGGAGAFDVQFYLSDDANIQPGLDLQLQLSPSDPNYDPSEPEAYHVAGLAASANQHGSARLIVPASDPFHTDRNYFIGVFVDADQNVAESNEFNNRSRGAGLDLDSAYYRTAASFPFFEDWESGAFGAYWEVIKGSQGRIGLTSANGPYKGSYHVTLDDATPASSYSLNQLILHVNLAGRSGVELSFANREWADEDNVQDSVQISVDGGSTWHNVVGLTGGNSTDVYTMRSYDLDSLGLSYSSDTLIRFQQYGDSPIPQDGMAFDNIALTPKGGPSVTGHSPSGTVKTSPPSSVTLHFSEAIDRDSFSLAGDVVSFFGPAGDIWDAISSSVWHDSRTLEVTFDPQSADGRYEMVIGPQILDLAGHPMDQDGDGTCGEVPGDRYVAGFTLDLAAPFAAIDLAPGSDTGASDSDNVTADRTPTYSVTVSEPGTVEIDWEDDSAVDVTDAVGAAGTYYYSPVADLPDGQYPVALKFTDSASNEVHDTDPTRIDTLCPIVQSTTPWGEVGSQVSLIAVLFSETMWADTAADLGNYALRRSGGDGTFGDGNEVDVSDLIAQVSYDGAVTATVLLSAPLTDEAYQLTMAGTQTVRDVAGNPLNGGADQAFGFIVDAQLPAVDLALDELSDTGRSSSDGITSSVRPTYNVTVNEPGIIAIDWTGDGTPDAELAVPAAGTYGFSPSSDLAEGGHLAAVAFTDTASNEAADDCLTRIDTTPPTVAAVTPAGTVGSQVGHIEVVFSDAGGMWYETVTDPASYALRRSGGDAAFGDGNDVDASSQVGPISYDGATGTATLSLAAPLADEAYALTISGSQTVRDVAGNALNGGSDEVAAFLVDAESPAVAVDLRETSDTGVSDADNITSDPLPIYLVTVNEPGILAIDWEDDGAADVTMVLSSAGPRECTPTSPLADGAYAVVVTFRDTALNDATGSDPLTIDTQAPPIAPPPDLRAESDSGVSDADDVTNAASLGFDVTSADGYFRFYRDGSRISSEYETGGSFTAAFEPEGAWSYTVTALDAAGNESAASDALLVEVDREAPASPGAPDLRTESDTGISAADDLTNAAVLVFDVAGAGPYFRLYRGGALASGDYEAGPTCTAAAEPQGTWSYAAAAVDVAGNESPRSEALEVEIDRDPPAPPDAPDLRDSADTGISSADNVTGAAVIVLDLTGFGSYWRLERDGQQVGADYAAAASFSEGPLADGVYKYALYALDAAGNASAGSAGAVVTVDTTPPGAPPPPDLQPASDTGISDNDITADRTPAFDVETPDGLYFRLYRNGEPASQAPVLGDDGGVYREGTDEELPEQPLGILHYTATLVDAAGNESGHSLPLEVRMTSLWPIASHEYADGVVVSIYDVDPGDGVSSPHVAWSAAEFVYGETNVFVYPGWVGDAFIPFIGIYGTGAETAELGIVIEGGGSVGSIVDLRSRAAGPAPLGVIACEGFVGAVSVNAGIAGANLNGFAAEGGWALEADLDGDGDADDLTAVYGADRIGSLVAWGDVDGDLVIDGDLTLLEVLGGNLNGDVTLTGSNVGTVMAIAIGGQGGSINGDITANGNVNAVMAIGGGISGSEVSGSILAPTGRVGTVLAIGGPITSPTIYGQTGVNLVQAINGGIASAITSGGTLGTVMAIGGNIDLTGGRSISAGGTINALMAINGSILGDGAVSPDIYVGNGNLWCLQAIGGRMQNIWVDVNGSGASAGRLSSVYVGGNATGSRFEVDGLLSSLVASGSFTNSSVHAGNLSVVYVGETISEDSTDGDTDTIHADAGSYYVIDSTKFAHITPAAPATFGGLIASVG